MKVLLETFPIVPQTSAWCERACILNAISIRLWEKYKITKIFDANDFFTRNHFEHIIFSDLLKILKKEGLRNDVNLKSFFKKKMSLPMIQKSILQRKPILVQISNWKVENGMLEKGDTKGHFFVLYGFDDDFFYLQNPWGDEHYCKLSRGKRNMIGSFMSII